MTKISKPQNIKDYYEDPYNHYNPEWQIDWSGEISNEDFYTSHPNAYRLNNIAASLRFNKKMKELIIRNELYKKRGFQENA